MRKIIITVCTFFLMVFAANANEILIPMDDTQSNHLKAYGIAFWVLERETSVEWLLNYRGGSFMMPYTSKFEDECIIRNVSYQVISSAQANQIRNEIRSPSSNADVMQLDKAPKVAVYSPKSKQPWDDAVTLVMSYAEIPYDIIFDTEVLEGELANYDWLHLHHEDFTGQYGKFYRSFKDFPWYQEMVREYEEVASNFGYKKVSEMKLGVVKTVQEFVAGGGFLFAMCSATETFDVALAAQNVDFIERMYDGDGADPRANDKLDFSKTFAFENFRLKMDPVEYAYSNIDNKQIERGLSERNDFFSLFQFSAKWDPIPTMLTQNHQRIIKGFMGQSTAYKKNLVKSDVVILGETKDIDEARYLHGEFGKGFWTFYGGHDPEDYQHFVGEEPTDMNLFPNSPGYRLILNNLLFPAAKKKKLKT
ncbi:asparagine synthetase B [Fulvivirgaceae bacterium LMO-SS25]